MNPRTTTMKGGTMARGADRSGTGSLWILTPSRDLILFVATPLLILPLFAGAMRRWTVEEITLFVFAFGQIGHHLPGMMRTYGDRELFQRHKIRFIVAPLGLLVLSLLFVHWELKGLILVSAVWGIWHALMQTYGMLRIYDAKSKSFARATQRLDMAMCICWFGLAVLVSRGRLLLMLDLFFHSGGPLSAAALVGPLTVAWTVATAVVTLLFLINLLRTWLSGCPPNPVKLLLMATSFSFYWFTSVTVSNVLVGLAMFEVFHDVQYLAIVWVFNRNRVEKSEQVGGFTKFLFRRSGALMGLYLGLIFAYGSLYLIENWAAPGRMRELLTAMLATSGLLHYYYDGFIWKIRESSTRQTLDLDAPAVAPAPAAKSQWVRHAWKWVVFVLPVCWLLVTDMTTVVPKVPRLEALCVAVPENASTHLNLADAYHLDGDLDAAATQYQAAIRIDAGNAHAYNNLGLLLVTKGRIHAGLAYYQQSLALDPDKAETYNNLGNAYADLRIYDQAERYFLESLSRQPHDVMVHNNLALTLAEAGRHVEAERRFRQVLAIDASWLVHQRRFDQAAQHYRRALELNPQLSAARDKLKRLDALQRRLES